SAPEPARPNPRPASPAPRASQNVVPPVRSRSLLLPDRFHLESHLVVAGVYLELHRLTKALLLEGRGLPGNLPGEGREGEWTRVPRGLPRREEGIVELPHRRLVLSGRGNAEASGAAGGRSRPRRGLAGGLRRGRRGGRRWRDRAGAAAVCGQGRPLGGAGGEGMDARPLLLHPHHLVPELLERVE